MEQNVHLTIQFQSLVNAKSKILKCFVQENITFATTTTLTTTTNTMAINARKKEFRVQVNF